MAALGMGCLLSLRVKSLVRRESPLSFQLPRHSMLTNCEREVANDMKSLFYGESWAKATRPASQPCFPYAAQPLAEALNDQGWPCIHGRREKDRPILKRCPRMLGTGAWFHHPGSPPHQMPQNFRRECKCARFGGNSKGKYFLQIT